MRRRSIVVVIACATLLAHPVEAADSAQIEAARARGLAWLLTRQASDGSWRSAPGAEVATTTAAIHALRGAGGGFFRGYPYTAALAWLANVHALSVDSQARRLMALAPAGVTIGSAVTRLLDSRNSGRLWGTYGEFGTSIPDTALALTALRHAPPMPVGPEIYDALCGLLTTQKGGAPATAGSWGLSPTGADGIVLATVSSLLAIKIAASISGSTVLHCPSAHYDIGVVIERAVDWLLSQRRQTDGGFGEHGASTVFATALAYRALVATRPTDPATMAALDHLLARQAPDGSWNGDAFHTASVLEVLPPPAGALADGDTDGLPDAVETLVGTNPLVFDSRWLAGTSVNPVPSTGVAPPALLLPSAHAVVAVVLELPLGDGDLNLDGVVDAADIAIAERVALGQLVPTTEQLTHGDIAPAGAPDGVIDVADVARIRRRVLGLEGP